MDAAEITTFVEDVESNAVATMQSDQSSQKSVKNTKRRAVCDQKRAMCVRFSSEPSADQATPAQGLRFEWPQEERMCSRITIF